MTRTSSIYVLKPTCPAANRTTSHAYFSEMQNHTLSGIVSVAQEFPLQVLQQSVLAFLRAEPLRRLTWSSERGAHRSASSAALRVPAGGRSVLVIGDQSLAWCRTGIVGGCVGGGRERLAVYEVFTPHGPSCASASTSVHVGVSARLLLP